MRISDWSSDVCSSDLEALLYTGDPAEPGPAPIRFFYASDGRGAVSDAAPLPDGRILLVHRRLGFDPVFTTTLSVADPADIGKDAVLRARTIGRVPVPLAATTIGRASCRERVSQSV